MDACKISKYLFFLLLIFHPALLHAEVEVTGFASFVAGKTISGNQFLADYPKTGIYDSDWSFSPDTSIGIQLTSDISADTSITVQLINNGAKEYETESGWAYLNYQYSSQLSIQAGRKRIPLYYYSDTFDLGYAYHWIRPPVDNYTWQISNYNGISLIYEPHIINMDLLFNLYFGREDSNNNELLSLFAGAPVNEKWKNITGFVSELSRDWYEIRLSYMRSQLDREINNTLTDTDVTQHFHGLSINLYYDNFSFLSEFNTYERPKTDIQVKTSMQSIGYKIQKITPHITRSELKQSANASGGDEYHYTTSAGIRWEYKDNIALKFQFDKTTDKGITMPVLGNSELISFGADIIF
ncbi:MAG: porin [Gammaproteobacteria bacterium]|nr:porin [Gammaproteobacteria bacterium]MCW8910340.1 porin [Gammaproteobacteria bacterium]MCW9005233.1 porin [Gammaproteobacteria bacterium]